MGRRVKRMCILVAGVIGIGGPLLPQAAQISSPTKMTLAIMRGSPWSRLRTAVPAIFGGLGTAGGSGGAGMGRGGAGRPAAWNVAASLSGFGQVTLSEALDKQAPLFVAAVECSSTEKVSAEIAKNLGPDLTSEEISAVKEKLRAAGVRLVGYHIPTISSNEPEIRKLLQFAKELNIDTIVSDPPLDALPAIDRVASEFNVRIALLNRSRTETPAYADPQSLLRAVQGLSKHIGAAVDTASWMREGIKPVDGVKLLGDRLLAVRLLDRSALGSKGHNVTLGSGMLELEKLFNTIYRLELGPAYFSVEYTGSRDPAADMSKSLDALDEAIRPTAGERVRQISKTTAIRGPELLKESDRAGIEAAVPSEGSVKPRKPRKLLVIDLQVGYPGHGSVPAANLAVQLWSKKTGAYEAVFDNDLDNLTYPRIKAFDAIFLNNTVGQLFPDQRVRDGLMRFIREGGGLIGYHATPHASADWLEFGEMLAARAGDHRDAFEKATIKLDDPNSPLTAAFGGKEFEWQDEFFRFTTPPYSRDKIHMLLSFDAGKTDMHQKPDCPVCDRADNDIGVSWIRSFGKGRIFYVDLGHRTSLFAVPTMARFFLAGIQFALGDLDADTTPGIQPVSR